MPPTRRALARVLGASALIALAGPPEARADEPQISDVARAAYDRGTSAYERGDYAVAAGQFALADALAPHPVALKWALSAAVRADDPVLGMTLVERATRGPADAPLAAAVAAARQKFEQRVGGLTVRCPPAVECEPRIDGAPARAGVRTFVTPGSHLVEIVAAGRVERRWTSVLGGASEDVVGTAPPPPASTPAAPAPVAPAPRPTAAPVAADSQLGGISPGWFWLGLGLTAAAGGVTIASGVDTLAKHDDYLATRAVGGDEAGRSAQTRTNVLIGTTAVLGLTTALIGLFAVRWSKPARGAERSAARLEIRFR